MFFNKFLNKFIFITTIVLAMLLTYKMVKNEVSYNTNTSMGLKVSSKSFQHNKEIPSKYTCDGENINPDLVFENIPENTKSIAVIATDPDSPSKVWTHWTLLNIPPNTTQIAEGLIPENAVEGVTDFGETGYGGPCPGSGTHRYFFNVYALDTMLENVVSGASLSEIEEAMEGHVIDSTQIVGLYKRQ